MRPLRISIGMNIQKGPWGGGNQFGHSLTKYLEARGHIISFDLEDPNLDVVILTDPRTELRSSAYGPNEILRYMVLRNRKAIVIHRINENDERRGGGTLNEELREATKVADHTVFVSDWLRELHLDQGMSPKEHSVACSGGDIEIFHSTGQSRHIGKEPIRLITHHWSTGWFKGFDIYQRVDQLLDEEHWRNRVQMTYIGNLPKDFKFKNVRCLPPCAGHELADEIRKYHIYLTASQYEPSGNHHIEGALCGLPLLYRESGALPEYCDGFGIGFTEENFDAKLEQMLGEYDMWADKMADYPHTAEKMCKTYADLFEDLVLRRDEILARRRFWATPVWTFKKLTGSQD